jgi:hypothetical protein
MISPGGWTYGPRQEVLTPGHYEYREVRELVTPGHWEWAGPTPRPEPMPIPRPFPPPTGGRPPGLEPFTPLWDWPADTKGERK